MGARGGKQKIMDYLALIPARGGSKSIPRKNLLSVAGKELIGWSIEHALASISVNRVVVTTDSAEIAGIARKHGAETPFLRPAEFADDKASTEDAMLHAVSWLAKNEGYNPDAVVLLQPTSPIRHANRVDEAITQFESDAADSLVSVTEAHPFIWRISSEGAEASYDFTHRPRRQDFQASERTYRENGSIYITKTQVLLDQKCRLGGRISAFVMSDLESVDIDTPEHLRLSEIILNEQIL